MRGLLCAVAALVLSSCAAGGGETSVVQRATTTEYFVSEHGIRVGIRLGFAQDRVVTGARMLSADESVAVPLYPLDGSDPDRPPERLRLAAGREVLLEGHVVPACPVSPGAPVFVVESLVEGRPRTDRFRPDAPAGFDHAFFEWCERPPTLEVTGGHRTPRGRYEVTLQVSNPGPETATVVSRAVTVGATRWRPTQVDVPAGAVEQLRLVGHGTAGCAAPAPWETGDLLLNGSPVAPDNDDDWC